MAKRKNHSPEQIVRKLKTADEIQAGGASGDEIARQLGISTATLYNWRNRYGQWMSTKPRNSNGYAMRTTS